MTKIHLPELLGNLLNKRSYRYKQQNGKLNHLFNIDNVKTFAKDDKQQKDLLTIIKTFPNNMKMEFGSEKCTKATFKRGNLSKTADLDHD